MNGLLLVLPTLPLPPLAVIVALVLAMAVAGIAVLAWLGGRGGWLQLARVHPHRAPHRFARVTTVAVSNGGPFVVYRWIADAKASEHGLHLAILFPFAPKHPPIFIPWERLGLTHIDDRQATIQVVETPFVVRVHASKVIAQVRYWLDVLEPPPEDLLP
jgi:hypothetical protein